jgi:hypothetical protein
MLDTQMGDAYRYLPAAVVLKAKLNPFQLLRLRSAPLRPAQVKAASSLGPCTTMEIAQGNFRETHSAVE